MVFRDTFTKIKLTKFEIERNMKGELYMKGFDSNENITILD